MVRLAMVYGLETMAVTKKQMKEMEIAEMKMLRFAMGMTRKDKVVKEVMEKVDAKETGVEDKTVWRRMIRCGYP